MTINERQNSGVFNVHGGFMEFYGQAKYGIKH